MIEIRVENPALVAKRAFWLAWQACGGTLGSGFLQDRADANEDLVWLNVIAAGDYPGSIKNPTDKPYADYVFGRMLKVGMTLGSNTISIQDSAPHDDYQAWCTTYPTYRALIEAAIKDLA